VPKKVPEGLEEYFFELPERLIAQDPPPERGGSRLLALSRETGRMELGLFRDLERWLPPGALLVLNEARVSPARLLGESAGGGRAEALILEPGVSPDEPGDADLWCLARPGRRLAPGKRLLFRGGGAVLGAEVLAAGEGGRRLIRFSFADSPSRVLEAVGHLPLPPYIRRPDRAEDFDRYQTVYAKRGGSAAAPTAGLHFTRGHLERLRESGFGLAFLHLMVGAGTFQPLTAERLKSGRLHGEPVEVPEEAAQAVAEAKKEGRRVLAVGTTTLRALEWAGATGRVRAGSGVADLFIRPGCDFKIADALLTNFHLPASSLFVLVSAFAGKELAREAYRLAAAENMRFYSYGDAMLIL
jgi:S-adenosylmethionine:tRNA ribosyltransferase-isomerase